MRLCALLLVAGCFDPHPPAGRPCADVEPRCPSGLVCSPATSTCEREARMVDAPIGGELPIDTPAGPCLRDDFNTGIAADWIIAEGTWQVAATGGPDGSAAFRSTATAQATVTHPALQGITSARISLDFKMEGAATGDFFVRFFQPPWLMDPASAKRYTVSVYVDGGDDPADRITIQVPPSTVELTKRVTTIAAATWHHADVTFAKDNAFRIDLDGAKYMEVTSDTTLAPPYDLAFRFWQPGAIDNVVVDCTH
jgi:hypothetical protein